MQHRRLGLRRRWAGPQILRVAGRGLRERLSLHRHRCALRRSLCLPREDRQLGQCRQQQQRAVHGCHQAGHPGPRPGFGRRVRQQRFPELPRRGLQPRPSSCSSINHGIVLVGWDDSVGAWILRNSWGANWGESGYMRIAYGKNYVGYAAAYVVYNSSTPPAPPAAPSGLTATAASSSQINLAWTDSDTETGYRVQRCTGASCSNFAQIATAGANATSYADTGLTASTSYSYRVLAYNGGGDSTIPTRRTPLRMSPRRGRSSTWAPAARARPAALRSRMRTS